MPDRPFGADCATPHPSSGLAALPVEVIAPDPEFTPHGNTVLPVGVLQPDGERWKPVARVVLSPDERARLIVRLIEHEGLEATRTGAPLYETASPAEAIALTGQHHPAPVDVSGPVQTLAVEIARLEAHIEELTASREKMARQIAEEIMRRSELAERFNGVEEALEASEAEVGRKYAAIRAAQVAVAKLYDEMAGKVGDLEARHAALVKSSHGALEDLEAKIESLESK